MDHFSAPLPLWPENEDSSTFVLTPRSTPDSLLSDDEIESPALHRVPAPHGRLARAVVRNDTFENVSWSDEHPFYATGEVNDLFINAETEEAGDVAHRPRQSQGQWAGSLLRTAVSTQLARARTQLIIAQAQFQSAKLGDEIMRLDDQRLRVVIEHRRRGGGLQPSGLDVVAIRPDVPRRDQGSQSILSQENLQTLDEETVESPGYFSQQEVPTSDLTELHEALTAIQMQIRKLDRELERAENRLSAAGQRDLAVTPVARVRKALSNARTRSAQMDEAITAAANEVQNVHKQIEQEHDLQAELNVTIDKRQKEGPPPIAEVQKGSTECRRLLIDRLSQSANSSPIG
jgi:hypothetical protein